MRGKFIIIIGLLVFLVLANSCETVSEFSLTTDKVRYNPGDTVSITITTKQLTNSEKAEIKIYHLENIIFSEKIDLSKNGNTEFNWKTPSRDYCGYLVNVEIGKENQKSIAVDVSSDWAKYIRYGFLSKYPQMNEEDMDIVLKRLNRFHINGLQFYDYHYMHQQPIKLENGQAAENWPDIAGRLNYSKTVKYYIEKSRQLNMKSMAYNLIYGTWERGFDQDVKPDWLLYKDKDLTIPNKLDFPDSWEDDICYMDPGNAEWQDYLIENTKPIKSVMNFDGWHVDQIGDIRPVYNIQHEDVKLDSTFRPFLQKAKEKLQMPIVMNAVNQYAQDYIATSNAVDFLYTEVWNPHTSFSDLINVIKTNDSLGNYELSTVLAAYMNYDKHEEKGRFNTPGILFADAVIFASGAAHLELGEHMLCHEYFPNDNLKMSDELEENLVNYYDFFTAYENLLRDAKDCEKELTIKSNNQLISLKPEKGKIWMSQRKMGNYRIVHLINFTAMKAMNWRDPDGTCPEPQLLTDIHLEIENTPDITEIFFASPDSKDLRLQSAKFENGETIIPSLKYWTMVVVKN